MTLYDINSSIGRRLSAAADENAATKRFLDNVNALSQDGYRRLALALLDAGGDVASRFAEAASQDQAGNNWRPAREHSYDVTIQGGTAYVFDSGGLPLAVDIRSAAIAFAKLDPRFNYFSGRSEAS